MLVKPYNLTINLDKPTLMNNVIIKRGDHKSRRLIFNIISNGKCVDAKEIYSVAIKATKPDETIIHDEVMIEDGKMYYDLNEQVTAVVGEVECELEIFGTEGQMLSSPNFYLTIQDNVYMTEKIASEDLTLGIKAYVTAAYEVMERTQQIYGEFEMTHGSMGEVLKQLEYAKAEYVTYIDTLKKMVTDGYFNGPKGAQGEKGADAVVIQSEGIVGFQIEDGCLMCYTEDK